jgi:hypothetical protein
VASGKAKAKRTAHPVRVHPAAGLQDVDFAGVTQTPGGHAYRLAQLAPGYPVGCKPAFDNGRINASAVMVIPE